MTREEKNEEKQKEVFWENNKANLESGVKKTIKLIFIIILLFGCFFLYTTYVSTAVIEVREYRYINNKIPNNFNGLKIIHFSDLHYGSTMTHDNMKTIKKKINERNPDIIVFTGDLIDPNYKISHKEKEKLMKDLQELNATMGKYAVTGDEDSDDIYTIYSQSDFIILKNEYDLLYKDETEPIMITGVSSFIKDEQDIAKAYDYYNQEGSIPNIFNITIMHEPDTFSDIISNYDNIDLVLAGHSHNGYIRTPITHIPLYRRFGAKKYPGDYYKEGNSELYVSGGLGTNNSIGIRLFCRPSISLYRLSNN